jgi:hypothetical protein
LGELLSHVQEYGVQVHGVCLVVVWVMLTVKLVVLL